ncbi:MAG TPA: Na+/H+ antiporter subunit D [Candidatus Limnocylindria bacterium]|nr:Na+/H+ antiporter subunit D [Candidatus Limnocylindria bacterium]
MSELLVLPLVIPLAAAGASLVFWGRRRIQRWLAVLGTGSQLLVGVALLVQVRSEGIQVVEIGGWPAPFGIVLVADLLSSIMVVLTGLIGFAVALYSLGTVEARHEAFGYFPLLQILLLGVCGAFLTGDIFNLYVWFEVMLIASFVLLALGGRRSQIEGAIKYVTLNLIASIFFLTAVGVLYGVTGTLNMADLSLRLDRLPSPGLQTALAMLFLVAFGIKAAMFPLFFWLPASYHTPPPAVTALFAGLLTKVGVYAMLRVFTLIFDNDVGYTHTLILALAGLTMVVGALGALAQHEIRRILSFLIISGVGYMLLGLGMFTALSLAAAILYLIHDVVVKANLFLISGVVRRISGSYELARSGGLYAGYPALALFFLVPALSLAGVPPLSGFIAKLGLVQAGVVTGDFLAVGVVLVVSFLTLWAMARIWQEAFWKKPSEGASTESVRLGIWSLRAQQLPIVMLAAITIAIGLLGQPVFQLAFEAADQLMQPSGYIEAVLGTELPGDGSADR